MTYTPWSTQLQDRDDNILIVSAAYDFTGELMDSNPDEFNPRLPGNVPPSWFYKVIETFGNEIDGSRVGPPARLGEYLVQEVLGGDDPIDAADCVWSHTAVGDQGHGYWNASGVSPSGPATPPVCVPLPGNGSSATDSGPSRQPSYSFGYSPGSLPVVAGSMAGEEHLVARGAWFLPVRDNLPPYGVLNPDTDIDFIAAGLPADYIGSVTIEYEDEFCELVQVDAAGDRIDQGDTDTFETGFHINTEVLPAYGGGEWTPHWSIGVLSDEPLFTYGGGASTWNPVAGVAGWDDCHDWPTDDPDATIGMALALDGSPDVDTAAAGDVDLAFRFVLRAPRFRLIYDGASSTPRRFIARGDHLACGAERWAPRPKSIQRGRRFNGAVW
jgi:hypothetical protein